ncbi:hypothetical protein MOUN0_A03840 [Monosporozyma unispora]
MDEKNWSPFRLPHSKDFNSALSRGYIYCVHTDPLRILCCSLNTGWCKFVFSGKTLNIPEDIEDIMLRGETQFVPLPNVLPNIKDKNILVGFTKTDTNHCGCGHAFYRPALIIFVESGGLCHLEVVSVGIDFGIEPLKFQQTGPSCDNTKFYSFMVYCRTEFIRAKF